VGIPTRVVFFSPEQAAALRPDRARALFAWYAAKSLQAAIVDGDPMELSRTLWARPVPFLLARGGGAARPSPAALVRGESAPLL
jgi:hypothetical protein